MDDKTFREIYDKIYEIERMVKGEVEIISKQVGEFVEKINEQEKLEDIIAKKLIGQRLGLSDEEINGIFPETGISRYEPSARSVKNEPAAKNKSGRAEILSSLDSVFIDDQVKDDIIVRVSIPDLLQGKEPSYSGAIFYGPPGTGKTVLLRAVADIYKKAGAYGTEISVDSLRSKWFGEYAKKLETEIRHALDEAEKRGKPSFIFFDEATTLVQKPNEGSEGVSKAYQEAMDVMKRYIGNERNLVVAISTNSQTDSFDDALIREGRLTTYFVGYPSNEQRKKMWNYFITKNKVMKLNDNQAQTLAETTPAEQGAFIEEFCRNYHGLKKAQISKQRGYNTYLDALKDGFDITDKDIKSTFSFEGLQKDLAAYLLAKQRRNQPDDQRKTGQYL